MIGEVALMRKQKIEMRRGKRKIHNLRYFPLQQPVLKEAVISALGDDQVVEQGDTEELAGVAQAVGELDVLAARVGVARRMVVGADKCSLF